MTTPNHLEANTQNEQNRSLLENIRNISLGGAVLAFGLATETLGNSNGDKLLITASIGVIAALGAEIAHHFQDN